MKRIVVFIVSVIIFSCEREKVSERVVFPENYEGVAMIYYNVPDGIEEKEDNEGWEVIEFPSNGFLLTRYLLPIRALYRREYYLKTKNGLLKIPELRTNDRLVDLKTFKGIDTTKNYVFSNMGGGSSVGPKDWQERHRKGEVVVLNESNSIDFHYENFIICKPNRYKKYREKVFDRSYINNGISQCEQDKLCYDKVYMEREFTEKMK